MVYVYTNLSKLNKYLEKELTVEEIEETLIDMGMDLKGKTKLEDGDIELKVELTAEKLDMISVVGIARAINYYRGFKKEIPKYKLTKGDYEVLVDESVNNIRPYVVGAIIKDLDITNEVLEEIIELQEKIHSSFGRNRKKAAIGIYPIDKIKFPIKYLAKKPEEIKFVPLGYNKELNGNEILELHETGKKYANLLKNKEKYTIFVDSKNEVLSMPPIINSETVGKVETTSKDLFIEITGFNLHHLDNILKVLTTTLIEMGGKAESVRVKYSNGEVYELNLDNQEDKFSLNYVNKIIGINISSKDLETLLPKVMIGYLGKENDLEKIEIPVFRTDIWNDVDVADDIARAYGYNNIKPRLPSINSIGERKEFSMWCDSIVKTMTNLGFLELYTYMLSSTKLHFDNILLDKNNYEYIKLIDSEDQGLNMIRRFIFPDNLNALLVNRKNKYPQKVFELGFVIDPDEKEDVKAKDEKHLSVLIADPNSNYTQIKQILDTLSKLYGLNFELKREEYPYFIEGRSASVYLNGENVGFIGELNPFVLSNFSLLVPVSMFEINIEKVHNLINTNK
jgi:phenylalanyl-tRNA synthetase beta chain